MFYVIDAITFSRLAAVLTMLAFCRACYTAEPSFQLRNGHAIELELNERNVLVFTINRQGERRTTLRFSGKLSKSEVERFRRFVEQAAFVEFTAKSRVLVAVAHPQERGFRLLTMELPTYDDPTVGLVRLGGTREYPEVKEPQMDALLGFLGPEKIAFLSDESKKEWRERMDLQPDGKFSIALVGEKTDDPAWQITLECAGATGIFQQRISKSGWREVSTEKK